MNALKSCSTNLLAYCLNSLIKAPKDRRAADFVRLYWTKKGSSCWSGSIVIATGLMVLNRQRPVQAALSHPKYMLTKRYWVQVKATPDEQALSALRSGVMLQRRKTGPQRRG